MASVIERQGYRIDDRGYIHYDDTPSNFDAADKVAGRRLDRRRNYCIMDGKVHESTSWTAACSGCTDGGEYPSGRPGIGCDECGYHGVKRQAAWIEVEMAEISRRAI